MRCIITIALMLCLMVMPCNALTLFKADYDGDTYTEETAYSGDWLPLRELSEILPYSVEWKDRTVYIYADRTWEIKPDQWTLKSGPIPGSATSAFNSIPSDCIIYVPAGSLNAYQTATNWSTYSSYMREESV